MATLTCPLCGSLAKVPSAETNTRYVCKKCHSPFHLNKAGEAAVGAPPTVDQELEEIKQKLREAREKIPVGRIVAGVSALVVVGLLLYLLLGPSEGLEGPAERAAQAVSETDLDYLQSIAVSGTQDDVARWLDKVHPRLVQARETWHGRDEAIEIHIAEEAPGKRKGSAMLSFHAASLGTRDVGLADPTAATAAAAARYDVATDWILTRWGRWKLDGRETFAKVQPAPESNVEAEGAEEEDPAGAPRSGASTRRP